MNAPLILPATTLGNLIDVLSGFAFKSDLFSDDGNVPVVRIRDVKRGYSETFYTGEYDSRYMVNDGDILIGMDGEFNRERWRGGGALLNQRVCKIMPDERRLSADYLYHLLPKALKDIEDRTPFVTVKHLSAKDIKDIQIVLPPLDEQRRIAAILDKADELRRKRKHALDLIKQGRDSLIETALRDSSNGQGVPLKGYLEFMTTGGRNWSQYYSEGGSRFIRSLDVQMNRISDEDAAHVTPPDNAEARRTRTQEGDVLLTVTGSRIGRVAELPASLSGSYVSQHVAILRLDCERLRPKFLSFFLSSQAGQQQIQKWQYGQTKPGLNFRQIGDFLIPKITIDLQIKLERAIERFGALIVMQEVHAERFSNLFSSLRSRAFSGQL